VDTGKTLQALGADCIVVRHPSSGAPHVLARNLQIPIINAGDGMHEHPSQGLLDAYTILRHKKSLKGLKVTMIGDISIAAWCVPTCTCFPSSAHKSFSAVA